MSKRGSFGNPSTRSAMMLRWISSVPPAIDTAGNGSVIAAAGGDGKIRLWNGLGSQPPATTLTPYPVTALALAPDRHGVAAGTKDGRLVYWSGNVQTSPVAVQTSSGAIVGVAFDRTGRVVAVGDDGAIDQWDGRSQSSLRSLPGAGQISAIGFSPDAQIAAISDSNDHLKILDLQAARVLRDAMVAGHPLVMIVRASLVGIGCDRPASDQHDRGGEHCH